MNNNLLNVDFTVGTVKDPMTQDPVIQFTTGDDKGGGCSGNSACCTNGGTGIVCCCCTCCIKFSCK